MSERGTRASAADVTVGSSGAEKRFAYVIAGEMVAGDAACSAAFVTGEAAGFDGDGGGLRLVAGEAGAHVVVAGGTPLREPVVFYGPFCMSSREDIVRVVKAYESGALGRLAPSF